MNPRPPPTTLPAAVARALAAFPEGERMLRDVAACECIKRGRTNDTWRVRGAGRDWVVRIGAGRDERLALDREREATLLRRLAPLGYAPAVVCVLPARGLLVSEYVTAREPGTGEARGAPFLALLGRRLRELHALAVPAGAHRLDLAQVLAHYEALAAPQHSPVPRAVVAGVCRIHLAAYVPARVALCHHDLHRANIRLSAPLCFIDWEYAAYGDPVLDLAAYASYEDLDEAGLDALLAAYGPAPGLDAPALRRAIALFDALRVLWVDAADAWSGVAAPALRALQLRLAAQRP